MTFCIILTSSIQTVVYGEWLCYNLGHKETAMKRRMTYYTESQNLPICRGVLPSSGGYYP